MFIYTTEQVTAATAVIHTDAILIDYINHEPADDAKWNRWNDGYQAAYDAYETAASIYRRLVGTAHPDTVTAAAPSNPLIPAVVPECGTVETEDRRFIAGPFFHSKNIGPWAVDVYDPPLTEGANARRVITVNVVGRQTAQDMVDLASWALDTGARTSEAVTA